MLGIEQQVENDLLNLLAVDEDRQHAGVQLQREGDVVLGEGVLAQARRGARDLIEVGPRPFGRAAADEGEQVADDLAGAPGTIVIRTDGGEHAHTLQVSDDGPGISQELRGRVFEPFFTTKEVGQGTGLGLSLGLGIATAHGGALELLPAAIDASTGRPVGGATFQLTLPAQRAAEPAQETERDEIAAPTKAAAGVREALVIEDEAPVRDLLVRLLGRRHYRVTAAASFREAQLASDGRTFDLVLCDVRLADGNGAECLRHLTKAQPAIGRRFVFVTGDIGALAADGDECASIPVLTKPFTVTDLDRVLGDVEVGV